MITNEDLHQKVSQEKLENLLKIHGEGDDLDFKQVFSLNSSQARAELVRDMLAFANTEGGGHIIFGVDKTYEPIGLPQRDSLPDTDRHIDTTRIYNAIDKYIADSLQFMAAEYEIQWPTWPEKRRFGILYVARSMGIAMARCDVSYHDGKKDIKLVRSTDILVRRGAQSCHADQSAMNRLLNRTDTNGDMSDELARPLDDNLPSRDEVTIEFVGRMGELTALWNWFENPSQKRWLLTGYGGKGKTAIAYEFATEIKIEAPKGFDYVLWLSAKEREFDLEEGIIQPRVPDFWDLPSLLDAILRGYGFTEDISLPLAEKQKQCIKILTELPALLIADDIDSLEEKNEGAIEFLVSDLASTPSKILLTSRRVPFGFRHIKTEVSGLSKEDGEKFISSRVRLFKLDKDNPKTRFSPRVIQEILQITESSPLYIEDLLRLCVNFAVEEAISDWKKEGGDNARKYALEKEFDLLTPSAKETVFACCIPPSAVSLSEIQVITGKSLDLIKSEMVAIQNLFLVSHPKPFDSGERYDVNTNTRMLILRTYGHTDTFNRLKRSYEGQFGRLNIRQKNEVASHIREAISIQRLGRHKEAEKLLQSALEHYPNNPDLTAQLGMIYYYWQPRRLADASHQFELAEQLGCKHERMYRTWANMEIDEREWTKAIAVAEAGINVGNESAELYRLAGYAHSRQGQYLKRSYHTDLAQRELLIADSMLQKGLKDPEELAHYEERIQNSRAFRALVINCAELGQIEEMHRYIDRWQREYPQDPYVIREGERFRAAYPIR